MNKKYIACAVLVILIVGVSLFFIKNKRTGSDPHDVSADPIRLDLQGTASSYAGTIVHSYADGIHTYNTIVELPTSCHVLANPDVRVLESYPEQINIILYIAEPDPGIECDTTPQEKSLELTATASPDARLQTLIINNIEVPFSPVEE